LAENLPKLTPKSDIEKEKDSTGLSQVRRKRTVQGLGFRIWGLRFRVVFEGI
jgi:hypothetical protein